jgi:hypothetical protein
MANPFVIRIDNDHEAMLVSETGSVSSRLRHWR